MGISDGSIDGKDGLAAFFDESTMQPRGSAYVKHNDLVEEEKNSYNISAKEIAMYQQRYGNNKGQTAPDMSDNFKMIE